MELAVGRLPLPTAGAEALDRIGDGRGANQAVPDASGNIDRLLTRDRNDPGMEVVGDAGKGEAGLLGPDSVLHESLRTVLLTGERVADLRHAAGLTRGPYSRICLSVTS